MKGRLSATNTPATPLVGCRWGFTANPLLMPGREAILFSMVQAMLLAIVIALLGARCSTSHAVVEPPLPVAHRVLFIGNSLTATNNLPATIAAIARSGGDSISVKAVVGPGLALIDHYNGATDALAVIREGGWDYVVLQQGPTSTGGVCQDSLILWSTMFATRIEAVGATTALFMVWPARDRLAYFDDVRTAYQLAASASHGVFLPAGEAWRAAWVTDSGLPLYGPDDFHPSPMGTFLASLEIYERLSGRDVRTLPPVAFANGVRLAVPTDKVRVLQAAAHQANQRFPAVSAAAPRPGAAPASGPGPGTLGC